MSVESSVGSDDRQDLRFDIEERALSCSLGIPCKADLLESNISTAKKQIHGKDFTMGIPIRHTFMAAAGPISTHFLETVSDLKQATSLRNLAHRIIP